MTDPVNTPAETPNASASASASASSITSQPAANPATANPPPAGNPPPANPPASANPPAPANPPVSGQRDNITRITESVTDCAEATERARIASENAMQFQRDAQQQQNEAQNALREAEQAAEDTVTLANRVAEATKRAVANAQALDPSNQAPSSSSANSDAWAKANVPLQLPPMPTSPSTLQTIPLGRPIDPITSTVAQLNNLVVGTAPAFSTAMRLATDSVATGIASHNAVSHQANQSITALLMQMRASANLVKGE